MTIIDQILVRREFDHMRHSFSRLTCLGAVVLFSILVLGASGALGAAMVPFMFQTASLIAGFIACSWAASMVLDERMEGRLEPLIAMGANSWTYLLSRLTGLFALLLLPGCILVPVIWISSFIQGVGFAFVAPLVQLISVYVPVVVFGLSVGLCWSTITHTRAVGPLVFALLWLMGTLPVVALQELMTVAAQNLEDSFITSLFTGELGSTLSGASVERMSSSVVLLLVFALIQFGIVGRWLSRRWNRDASSLIVAKKQSLHVPLPVFLLVLKTVGIGRILAVSFLMLLAGALVYASQAFSFIPLDSGLFGIFLLESFTPLCFALLFASIVPTQMQIGINEMVFHHPGFPRIFITRIIALVIALLIVLGYQAMFFSENFGRSAGEVIVIGLTPSLLFGGIACLLGALTRNESTASTVIVVVWLLLFLPGVASGFQGLGVGILYPFPLTMGLCDDATPIRLLLLATGVAFLIASVGLAKSGKALKESGRSF